MARQSTANGAALEAVSIPQEELEHLKIDLE
jgi:hypothetical protein